MTKYFTCGVCGREFHESMGDTHPASVSIGVCCLCKKKMNNGLWPTRILRTNHQVYVLWNVKRDVVETFDKDRDRKDCDLFDVDYIEGKRAVYQIPMTKEGSGAFKHLVAKGGYIRSIHPLNKKMPVFHWGYHRLMWGLLVKYNGRIGLFDAWRTMERLFPQIENIICNTAHLGFACPAAIGWDGETTCRRCPLEWDGIHTAWATPCTWEGSSLNRWYDWRTSTVDRKHYARVIMYLPLSLRAESIYTIDN